MGVLLLILIVALLVIYFGAWAYLISSMPPIIGIALAALLVYAVLDSKPREMN